MRPRRNVFLYCADYDRRNDLAFVLRVRCTWARIEAFADLGEMTDELRDPVSQAPLFDCIILVAAGPCDRKADGSRRNGEGDDLSEKIDFEWLLRDAEVAGRAIEVRMAENRLNFTGIAAQWAMAGDIVGLQEKMRVASARKRGPKKVHGRELAAAGAVA